MDLFRRSEDAPSGAERVTLVISLALLVGLIAAIVWIDVRTGNARARISGELDVAHMYVHGDQWYVPVTIRNDGDRTAESLRVDVVRDTDDPQSPEVNDLTFDFVAGGEELDATVAFDERPTLEDLHLDVISVTDP